MWPNTQFPADLVTFTEEILYGKHQFFVHWVFFLFVFTEVIDQVTVGRDIQKPILDPVKHLRCAFYFFFIFHFLFFCGFLFSSYLFFAKSYILDIWKESEKVYDILYLLV